MHFQDKGFGQLPPLSQTPHTRRPWELEEPCATQSQIAMLKKMGVLETFLKTRGQTKSPFAQGNHTPAQLVLCWQRGTGLGKVGGEGLKNGSVVPYIPQYLSS